MTEYETPDTMRFDSETEFALYIRSKGGCAYVVGGAVRDEILGRRQKDKDYVVTGITTTDMSAFRCVGSTFPVFLVTIAGIRCEVALARKERKIDKGHRGFEPLFDKMVTIEEDLGRRDFTINSIAKNLLTGEFIDPFGGKRQLESKESLCIDALSSAFMDDPLRVLRAARFSSILDIPISSNTMSMMRRSRSSLSELSAERVFQELRIVLSHSNSPSSFFLALRDSDCLSFWFPEVDSLIGIAAGPVYSRHGVDDSFEHTMKVLDSYTGNTEESRFACLCHDLGKAISEAPPKHHGHEEAGIPLVHEFCNRLKVPNAFRGSALCFTSNHMRVHRILEMRCGKAARLVYDINKCMTGGLGEFLLCSIADGMDEDYSANIFRRAQRVFNVRLPKQYMGRGTVCHEIMENLRGKEWSRV